MWSNLYSIILFLCNKLSISSPLFLDPHIAGFLLVLCWAFVQSCMFLHIQVYYGAYFASEIFYVVLFVGVFFLGGCLFTGLYFSSLTDHLYASEVILNPFEVTEMAVPEREISAESNKQKNQSEVKPAHSSVPYSIGLAIVLITVYLLLGHFPIN